MKPGEHKTVQARILAYAEAIGWTIVSREEAEERSGGIPAPFRKKDGDSKKDGDRNVPAPVRTLNPRYSEKGPCPAAAGFRHLHPGILSALS